MPEWQRVTKKQLWGTAKQYPATPEQPVGVDDFITTTARYFGVSAIGIIKPDPEDQTKKRAQYWKK